LFPHGIQVEHRDGRDRQILFRARRQTKVESQTSLFADHAAEDLDLWFLTT
jgi:hypothetical protein